MRPLLLSLIVGCSSAAPPAARPGAEVQPRAMADAPARVTFDAGPPPVAGPVTPVLVRQQVEVAGVTVHFLGNSHKHVEAGDPPLGMWDFELRRGDQRRPLALRSSENDFEVEVDAFGVLLVLRQRGYDQFDVIHVATPAPAPLDEQACFARIEAEAARRGLPSATTVSPDGTGPAIGTLDGFISVTASTQPPWRAYCGTYTRRIWFVAP